MTLYNPYISMYSSMVPYKLYSKCTPEDKIEPEIDGSGRCFPFQL